MDKKVLFLLVLITIINAFFNSIFQLHYDEAYYWVWGQNLSLSYFDHPPLIAYLIRLFNLIHQSEFWVRLPALLCALISILIIFRLAKKIFDKKVANIAVMLIIAWPMMQGNFFVATPDAPLLMFWSAILYSFYSAIFENKVKHLYLAGIWAGFALLSKYTAILIFPSLFLFLIFSPNYRHYLLKKEIYLAFLLSIIVFAPVIIWNYQHQWISFLFQFHHGIHTETKINIATFGDYIGGQALITNPVIFIALIYYLIKTFKVNLKNEKLAFLLWPFLFIVGFFTWCSMFAHMEVNWPAPGYISVIILLAYWLNYFNNTKVYKFSIGIIILMLILVKMPKLFIPHTLKNHVPIVNTFYAGREMVEAAKPYLNKNTIILACDYGNASRVWFYLDLPRVYVLEKFEYSHNFKYWNQNLHMPIKKAIYICDSDDKTALKNLQQYFKTINLIATPSFSNSVADYKTYIYEVTN